MDLFHDISPIMIPIAGIIMPIFIFGIIFWYKAREKELEAHKDLRMKEMEHEAKMKALELEIEKTKAAARETTGSRVS